jgi:hypothetical protein
VTLGSRVTINNQPAVTPLMRSYPMRHMQARPQGEVQSTAMWIWKEGHDSNRGTHVSHSVTQRSGMHVVRNTHSRLIHSAPMTRGLLVAAFLKMLHA